MASALDGITVLDLGTGPAAALATMFFSDHGARVIRIVQPEDAGMRDGGFIVWDRGKAVVKLDLRAAAADRENANLFRRLVAGADVLVAGSATFKGGPEQYAANIAALKGGE